MPIEVFNAEEIRRCHQGHYFSPSTMRFFRSRLSGIAYRGPGGVFFVTSEQFVSSTGERAARRYTVRFWNEATDSISTTGEFNRLSRGQAHLRARRLAGGGASIQRRLSHDPAHAGAVDTPTEN